jgi:hypothetical protein
MQVNIQSCLRSPSDRPLSPGEENLQQVDAAHMFGFGGSELKCNFLHQLQEKSRKSPGPSSYSPKHRQQVTGEFHKQGMMSKHNPKSPTEWQEYARRGMPSPATYAPQDSSGRSQGQLEQKDWHGKFATSPEGRTGSRTDLEWKLTLQRDYQTCPGYTQTEESNSTLSHELGHMNWPSSHSPGLPESAFTPGPGAYEVPAIGCPDSKFMKIQGLGHFSDLNPKAEEDWRMMRARKSPQPGYTQGDWSATGASPFGPMGREPGGLMTSQSERKPQAGRVDDVPGPKYARARDLNHRTHNEHVRREQRQKGIDLRPQAFDIEQVALNDEPHDPRTVGRDRTAMGAGARRAAREGARKLHSSARPTAAGFRPMTR